MSRLRKKHKRSKPPSFIKRFWQRYQSEISGALILGAAAFLSLAVFSYNPVDASWNTAGEADLKNWAGAPGAVASDFLLQSFGLAAFPPLLILWIWGMRQIRSIRMLNGWLRALLLPLGLLLLSAALATLTPPDSWQFNSGLGGWAGQLILAQSLSLLSGMPDYALALAGSFAGLGAVAVLALSSGLSLDEWRYYFAIVKAVSLYMARKTFRIAQKLAAYLKKSFYGAALPDAPEQESIEPEDRAEKLELPKPPERKKRQLVVEDQKPRGKVKEFKQQQLDFSGEDFRLPPLDYLKEAPGRQTEILSREALEANTRLLEAVLQNYGVVGEVVRVRPGPVVTLYEVEPAPGTKAARVISLADDIARNMSALSVRVASIPGRNVLGIELPNGSRETVFMREMLEATEEEYSKLQLPLILGKDIGGEPILADLARMPHLLIAGTTGSGKSVAINTMILSLLYRMPPDKCKLILIDPKMLELSVYQDIPHLLTPVVTDPKKAIVALKWAVKEMNSRYQAMSKLGVRNIEGYNQRLAVARDKGEVLVRSVQTGFDRETGKAVYEDQPLDLSYLPYIVVVVDEMADLMMVAGKDIEAAIQRLAQMARAAGIHLIMATQRPSVDVITGTIKANFPTRISFQVTSKIDSRTILGETGAEQLLGQGDMLYMAGGGRISRVHGPYVADNEVEQIAKFLRDQGQPAYLEAVTEEEEESDPFAAIGGGEEGDGLYQRALQLILRERKASTSFIQRHLAIGYNRAARIMDDMEARGVVSPANATGKREILIESEDQLYG